MNIAGGIGDEGASPGMGRAALQIEAAIKTAKPVDHAVRCHFAAPLRKDDGIARGRSLAQLDERHFEFRMKGNGPSAAALGGPIVQLDRRTDPPARIEHHRTRQVCGHVGDSDTSQRMGRRVIGYLVI